MRKILLVGVSAVALGFAGAAYAANSGNNSSNGGNNSGTASGSNAGNTATGTTASSSNPTSNSDTTSQRKECANGTRSADCNAKGNMTAPK